MSAPAAAPPATLPGAPAPATTTTTTDPVAAAAPPAEEKPTEPTPAEEKKEDTTDANDDNEEEEEDNDDGDDGDDGGDDGKSTGRRPQRKRKSVEVFSIDIKAPTKLVIQEGSGTPLGDIENIEYLVSLGKVGKGMILTDLHRLLFNRQGKKSEVRKNIRAFSGIVYTDRSAEREKMEAKLDKWTVSKLKDLCTLLDIERGGDKFTIITRIIDYLESPKPTGNASLREKAAKKRKKASKKKSTKSKKSTKKRKAPEPSGSDSEDEPVKKKKKGGFPSDATIESEIRAIPMEDLEEMSRKTIRQNLEEKFGVDLVEKKPLIKQILAAIVEEEEDE